jgi:hypothetical protein
MADQPPPPEIAHYVAAIGAAATLVLLEVYGGTRLYVPSDERGIASLGQVIGMAAAREVSRMAPGDTIRIPLAKAWRAQIYRAQGMTYVAIAKKLGCNDTTVWKYLRAAGATGAQLELEFG